MSVRLAQKLADAHATKLGVSSQANEIPSHARMAPISSPGQPDDGNAVSFKALMPDDQRYSQSLYRGLAIMGCYSSETPILGIADIAAKLDMSRSTTHRYVTTLVALGYMKQVAKRQYRLALGLTRLGMETMNRTNLREHARPLLQELRARTSFTVSLAVLDGPVTQCVDRVQGVRGGRREPTSAPTSSELPTHATALGKLLLSYLPVDAQRRVIGELTLAKCGPKTITNKRRLRQELLEIRETGIAISDEELSAGFGAIAVAVRNYAREVVASIGLSAAQSSIEMDVLAQELSPHLIATADRISARLGYRRADESDRALADL